ncbi:MAG: VWA domain-containing protein [Gammaproteobacteria bacterium]|nr:VWA domain-containing protein [Gammaproteobacteria bacterium]
MTQRNLRVSGIPFPLGSDSWRRGWRGLLFFLILLIPALTRAEAVPDVRVLIDISGSMKQNDPKNLRAPALRMLVGLMPEGTRSGVWTFGQYVNMQVPLGKVDQAWKNKAMAEAGKISSHGLYTNIEAAVTKATPDWTRPDPAYQRHLILLTDGMVDVGKDSKLDEASRQRLLQDVLPRLEAADVSIHTIALSKNADKELLSALSAATKGAFVQVDNADMLQRVFLKLFEKSVAPDALPIEDNKFTVDKHVSDFTVLLFRAKDSPETVLMTPDGKQWKQESHPDKVNWHHEDSYDLITVKQPAAGEWRLQAKVDPDNRVMIVTNLRLKLDKIPNTLLLGDDFDVRARLLEDGKTVDKEALLTKTQFDLRENQGSETVATRVLKDDGKAPDVLKGDGVYSAQVMPQEKPGEFEFVITASSLTFQREIHHTLQVYASPADYTITQPGAEQPFVLGVQPHAGLIRPESISMQVKLSDGETQILKQVGDLEWQAGIPNKYANQHITVTLVGKRYNDQDVKMDFDEVLAVTSKPQALSLLAKATEAKPEPVHAPVAQAEETTHAVTTAEEHHAEPAQEKEHTPAATKKGFSWTIVIILVVGVNVLLILGGWLGYRFWKKRQNKAVADVDTGVTA